MTKIPLVLLSAAVCAWGQSPRDEYRRNYQEWRQVEPAIESEAAAGDLAARAQRASVAAKAFVEARVEFLDGISREAADQLKRIQDFKNAAEPLAGPSPEIQTMVTSSAETAARVALSFGAAADAGIRQVRTALQQERTALDAISQAMGETRRTMAAAATAGIEVDGTREAALRAYQGVASARAQAADQMRKSGAAWEAYYTALVNPLAVTVSNAASPATPPAVIDPRAADTEVVRPPTITPLPLLRYTGGWMFPSGGVYHGTQPQSVDLTVREENGHVTGSFSARFVLPRGSAADPVVQFNFEGDLTANRNQTFELRTADGLKGTIELIPGPAFNLLEVNFQTEMRPNRLRNGNFLLVKK